jgi:glycosyltransferase involved in cell wall biosynthesis
MKKNKITIDVRMINSSGIGTYIKNLIPLIIEYFGFEKIVLIGDKKQIQDSGYFNMSNLECIDLNSPIYSLKEQLYLLRKIPKDTELFWSPHYNIPVFYRGKLLVTIHDVFHLANPQFVKGLHKRLYASFMYKTVAKKADAIISVSNFTRNELNRLVRINNNKIVTIHNGVDKKEFTFVNNESIYSKPYILYIGNVKPHKNLKNLLKAFEIIKDSIPHDLIIVGKKEGFITGDPYVMKQAEKMGVRVQFTGYVNNNKLKQYINGADALVFPSFYEGFGLPPLEAMACGCPVIVSNVASLPEVCGDAALYVDPYNPEDIAEKIKLLLSDDKLREELQRKGLERAKLFSWEKCAKETIKVIEEVLAK